MDIAKRKEVEIFKDSFSYMFQRFFRRCSIYLAPSGAKYCMKGFGRFRNWRGMIGTHILRLLNFGNERFWRLKAPKTHISGRTDSGLNFRAVIKSAASAASRETKNQGPRSRGAHGRRLGMRTTGLGWAPLDLGP